MAKKQKKSDIILIIFLVSLLIFYPNLDPRFPVTNYRIGGATELYRFFRQQPKDIMIASLSGESNNIPIFSQRSILVGREYAIPYHWGYYAQFRQRTIDLIQAQYSSSLTELKRINNKYKINFWLLDKKAFRPEYLIRNNWLKDLPPTSDVIAKLEHGITPALAQLMPQCSVFETENLVVLTTDCLH